MLIMNQISFLKSKFSFFFEITERVSVFFFSITLTHRTSAIFSRQKPHLLIQTIMSTEVTPSTEASSLFVCHGLQTK